ncbi:MAG TPA: phosphoribosylformylglycinamidine cyclo-ligase [Candidatus Polarisedimenticolaceae bacterium]|nr:phosphoribosylformylglycinamidine cyclo-ligase [Candidatus Polarisedimenticolaceae bacterium]
MSEPKKPSGLSYKDSGVDIDAQDEGLRRIKAALQATRTKGVLADLGAFGGMFAPDLAGLAEPVLVASCDGVGTKLKVAFMAGVHHTVGRDLVNHCVNDILVQGAIPLFFLDYLATGRLKPEVMEAVVSGVARGCKENGCALLGGETAEMPGFYAEGEYDVAGFIVGMVDKSKAITGKAIEQGDLLIGLPSAGLHTNGYSLARAIVFDRAGKQPGDRIDGLTGTIAEVLLAEHRSYLPALRGVLGLVRGFAHITGGGLTDNLPRILPEGTAARIERGSWPALPVFEVLQRLGGVADDEMLRTFNMGIGMVCVVAPGSAEAFERHLDGLGEAHHRIGRIVPGDGRVVYA